MRPPRVGRIVFNTPLAAFEFLHQFDQTPAQSVRSSTAKFP